MEAARAAAHALPTTQWHPQLWHGRRTARKVMREELEAGRRHGSARTSARQHRVLGAQHVRASLGEAAERRSSHAEPSRHPARLGQAPKERQAPTVPGGIPFWAG